jgi:molybdate transport system substrate-binding protein
MKFSRRKFLQFAASAAALPALRHDARAQDALEIRITSVLAMKQVLLDLTGDLESAIGKKLIFEFGTVAQVQKWVQSGAQFDLIFNNAPVIDELIATGNIAVGSRVDIAAVGIGIAIRAGNQKPDIGSVESFRATLLAAKSISRGDPRNRGAAGLHIQSVIETLGIAPNIEAKSRLAAGSAIAELVARGDVELGLALASEIVTVPGVELVGTLPKKFEFINVLSAGLSFNSTQRKTAITIIELLKSEPGRKKLKGLGLEPTV